MKAGPLIANPNENLNESPGETGPEILPALPDIALRRPPVSRGPLSTLYRGFDRAYRREVIVKVQRATEDMVTRGRFEREAAVMLRLRHPSIVALYAFHPGDPAKNDPAALVLEYVPGQTLAALAGGTGFLPAARAAQIVEEIAAALDCVHGIGIVHRDVKPSNILVPKRGSAKLADFGVARMDDDVPLTVMGDVLGTIEYASPEQVHGNGAVDTRSDVYSLAAVSYFALTGTPPFRAADSSTQAQLSVMHRQVFADPPPLRLHRADLSPAVEAVVLRGLAKVPDARYASAGQLAAALRAAVSASGEPQQLATEASARRTGAAAGALASVVLLLAGLALWKTREHAPPAPTQTAKTKPAVLIPIAAVPTAVKPIAAKPITASTARLIRARPTAPKTASAKPRPAAARASAKLRMKPVQAAQTPTPGAVKEAVSRLVASDHRSSDHRSSHYRQLAVVPDRQLAVVPDRQLAVVPVFDAPNPIRPPVLARLRTKPRNLPFRPVLNTAGAVSKPALAETTPAFAVPGVSAEAGWYTVSGWIALAGRTSTQKSALVQAPPLWVKVDGHPSPALAAGQWAELPAGKHLVIYQPSDGMGVGPKTWTMTLAPSAHLSEQVPLPPVALPSIPRHLRNP